MNRTHEPDVIAPISSTATTSTTATTTSSSSSTAATMADTPQPAPSGTGPGSGSGPSGSSAAMGSVDAVAPSSAASILHAASSLSTASAAHYSAAMTVRTAQALKAQAHAAAQPPGAATVTAAAAAAANFEIGSIAARAAAREAEAQLLVHEMLRSSSAGAVVAAAAAAVATNSTTTASTTASGSGPGPAAAAFGAFSFGATSSFSGSGTGSSPFAPAMAPSTSAPGTSSAGTPAPGAAGAPSSNAALAIPGGLAARRASANAAALSADLGYFAGGTQTKSSGSVASSPAGLAPSSAFANLAPSTAMPKSGLARTNSTASNRSVGAASTASHGSEGSAGSAPNSAAQPPPIQSYLASLGLSQVVLPSNNLIREQAERQMRELKIASEGGHFASADGSTVGAGKARSSAIAAVLGGVPSMPLMPTPPLQMLPPPPSPGFHRMNSSSARTPGGHSSVGTPLALVQQANRDGGFPFHSAANNSMSSASSTSTNSTARRSRPPTPGSAGLNAGSSGIVAMAPLYNNNNLSGASGTSSSTAAFANVVGHHTLTGQPRSPFMYPYPFQVVQTPGGTARAGWWIPKDEVPEERRKKARTVPGTITAISEGGEDGRGMDSLQEEDEEEVDSGAGAGQGAAADGDAETMPYFQPSFRIFTPEEYSALASAAAYATAALTSTRVAPPRATAREDTDESEDEEVEVSTWKPLYPAQQEAIATQLRAWAGLEGPERQKEARAALGERKAQIFTQAVGGASPQGQTAGDTDSLEAGQTVDERVAAMENPADVVNEPSLAAEFWPSDFASHYRAQLRALAAGYYVKLHDEAFSKVDPAPPAGREEDERVRAALEAREGRRKRRSKAGSSEMSAPVDVPPVAAQAEAASEVSMEGIEAAPAPEVAVPPGSREQVDEERRRHLQQTHRQRKAVGEDRSPVRKMSEASPVGVHLKIAPPTDPALINIGSSVSNALQLQERERSSQAEAASMALRDYERQREVAVAQQGQMPGLSGALAAGVQPASAAGVLGPEAMNNDPHAAAAASHDPIQLISAASNAAGVGIRSPALRDQLLQYAHSLYSAGAAVPDASVTQQQQQSKVHQPGSGTTASSLHPSLLPLLHTLHDLHPQHLPTLLLMSCVYYSIGNLAGSLWYNKMILSIDPGYVEAMSNIGTTLRALGKWREAEAWWWKAVKLRPGYWDAYENLLGVLCSPQQSPPSQGQGQANGQPSSTGPRFQEALKLCELVEGYILASRHSASGEPGSIRGSDGRAKDDDAPQAMPPRLPPAQASRLQNLFYAKGNLKYVLPEYGTVPAAKEYSRAVEVMLSPNEASARSLRDLIVSACVVGLLSLGATIPGPAGLTAPAEVAAALGLDLNIPQHATAVASGSYSSLIPGGILRLVRQSGKTIVKVLLRLGGGHSFPFVLLAPEAAIRVGKCIFAETSGVLPSLLINANGQPVPVYSNQAQVLQQAAQTTSTILLTMAKLYQDSTSNPSPGVHGPLLMGGTAPSLSLLLPLYYLSLSLHPSASTFNNLGILLSSLPVVTTVVDPATGNRQQLNGQGLAMQYYTHGLQLDPHHPHIYTNTGSLLKDLGHLNEAIAMYQKAIECNPNFDVALANLGNAIKDSGRTQESIVYYRRAVQVNPDFPEALCGLVNALLAVCDWREVYSEDPKWAGWMVRVSELVTKQLAEGALYGAGALQAEGRLQDWVDMIIRLTGDDRPVTRQALTQRLSVFFGPLDRAANSINEGSFVIRLIERLMRASQRRWYHARHGKAISADPSLDPSSSQHFARVTTKEAQTYARPMLPSALVTPAVPTVLPFHTFTYPLSARQIRLISHRNAIRISQSTLSQYWLPPHVYPPPAPPSPRINVGYVSSDLNNHPLAHLMQSVFGFHDRSRFNVYMYATTPSDQSPYRQKIENESEHFIDVSSWSNQQIVERILQDGIHVLMNLNGYTKGARNEVFAARPCPVQMEFMGFAGGLASSWTDWVVVDPIVCPPEMTCVDLWRQRRRQALAAGVPHPDEARPTNFGSDLDPEEPSEDWVYSERFIYMPQSYFVNDHAQGFREPPRREGPDGQIVQPHKMTHEEAWAEEEQRRWMERKELFPDLPDDFFIFTDFNQLYKCEPMLFKLWLRILARVPKSILWLLRFPAAAESHLLLAARRWAGDEVASRIVFTDVAPKHIHIHRGRIADLFLDTTECNAHTTAADILWSATPVLTWPRHQHKMCSRVAASIVQATGFGDQMIVDSEQAYEDRAVDLAFGLQHEFIDSAGNVMPPVERPKGMTAACLVVNTAAVNAQPHGTSGAAPVNPASAAPASSSSAAAASASTGVAEASPDRSSIILEPGISAPPGTVSRRGVGELAELRRKLFLTRDKNALFDTREWTRALERGYEEAWRRWVEGTDVEGAEWEALPEMAPEKQSGHIWLGHGQLRH
ncbi:unnamed protein product [Tilletia controversa]|uniref:protein O-GlcNAc transferase n=1 Tax=Tilletia controversa TaxID=13291 RepID=A0A8X7MXB9_9BASI|nr:hypothetical protein CF328_g2071 [Tilletia controversa]KAE8251554.1 hypothetical protein A4X06_0g2634 [Tilletia controversa]CAD6900755.1 unnamed protein product [Tilletia controversa]CAD6963654.1 unnamed protein product [Tilletia controversa]CAD6973353.1 unnamed protein product [Tilletia controversa]